MTATTHAPFIADGWLKLSNDEARDLVRPFYGEYLARLDQITRNGAYPYNDSFKGKIPSIDPATTGTTEKDQDTAIYLLQNLHDFTMESAKLAAFVEAGAYPITREDVPENGVLRGTVAVVGEYVGGTGYRVHEGVRVVRGGYAKRYLYAIPKGKRTNGYDLNNGTLYFLPERKGRKA